MSGVVDAAPFDLGPAESAVAALCIHGLSGTPYEVRPVAEALARAGFRARGIALPGHCTSAEELARTSRAAWVDAAHAALRDLRGRHDRVVLVGMSMGGVVSLRLAQTAAVDAMVAIGTPLYLGAPVRIFVPFVKHVVPMLEKRGGSDIRDRVARERHPGYKVMPLASVHELIKLQGEVMPGLSAIEAPILVAHGAHDRTAPPSNAQVLHDRVSSRVREVVVYARSGHVVPVDHDGPALAERVTGFVREVLG